MASTTNLRSQIVTSSSGLIERAILLIRGHRVMLDADLATLYQVSVKGLNQQVARNRDRFPEDFMFQLSVDEQVNIEIMRAFVRLREMLQTNKDLARKLDVLKTKYDSQFKVVFQAIRELMTQQPKPADLLDRMRKRIAS